MAVGSGEVVVMLNPPLMVRERDAEAVAWELLASVAVTVMVPLKALVGVPLMTPGELLPIVNPAGSPEAVQVKEPLPPVTFTLAVYAAPAVPTGRVCPVGMEMDGLMVREKLLVAVALLLSFTVMPTVAVPA